MFFGGVYHLTKQNMTLKYLQYLNHNVLSLNNK